MMTTPPGFGGSEAQHAAALFYEIPCVDDIVTAYLINLAVPPPDKRCSTCNASRRRRIRNSIGWRLR